ncbi:hypothetical protein E4U55_005955 [Claviceps digitariae]|nr:hypothetical protein E4U55_005955 [Claviceps digitariae]
MKFSMTALLALATTAVAAPSPALGRSVAPTCKYIVCTDSNLLAVDLDLDIDILGLIKLGLDVDVLLGHHRQCKATWCCPSVCQIGDHIPDTCSPY